MWKSVLNAFSYIGFPLKENQCYVIVPQTCVANDLSSDVESTVNTECNVVEFFAKKRNKY